jgi:hypothetical protein
MTEAEWLAAVDPQVLLAHHTRLASRRKLRLAAVACARHLWPLLADRWSREAVDTAERFADKAADRHDFAVARSAAEEAVEWCQKNSPGKAEHAARAAAAVTLEDPASAAREAARSAVLAYGGGVGALLCERLRDIFGNPFRPVVLEPSWLGRDGGIKFMARTLYDGRRFAELPALADALGAEGCQAATALLAHCRGPGPHVRGCWVLDMLTGRT